MADGPTLGCVSPAHLGGGAREIDVMRNTSRATRKRGANAVTSGPYSDPVWPYSYSTRRRYSPRAVPFP